MQIIKETSGNFKYEKMLKFKKAVFIYLPPSSFVPLTYMMTLSTLEQDKSLNKIEMEKDMIWSQPLLQKPTQVLVATKKQDERIKDFLRQYKLPVQVGISDVEE